MPLGKAFLSHSTKDKQFVEAVAKRLGRQQVQLDKWVFEVGNDLGVAINEAMESSSTFVLFASKASLASAWVQIEIGLAKKLEASDNLKSSLVFIIDHETQPSDLPKWMQKALISRSTSANAVARAIQYHLNRVQGLEHSELFLGRNTLLDTFAGKLLPTTTGAPPHLLILSGLEGVGRRTFLRHAVLNTLSIRLGPVFHLRRTDSVDALHLALVSELGHLDTLSALEQEVASFRAKTLPQKTEVLSDLLHTIALDNVVPCIVDDGALLESNSQYRPEATELFKSLARYPETVVALIHTHKPRLTDDQFRAHGACYEKIPALDNAATQQLLLKRLQLAKIPYTPEQVESLVPYLNGYPPAVALAVGLSRDYGLPVVLADKSMLVDFQIQAFAEPLKRLNLSDDDWAVLRILSAGLELPLDSLARAVGCTHETISTVLRRLIDLNLVLTSYFVFSIAYPLRFAVQASKGTLSTEEFSSIGRNLKETFWDVGDALPSYEIIESTISALLRSSSADLDQFGGLVLPSLIYRAAKDSYEQWGSLNWDKAQRLLSRLLVLEPNHRGALVLTLKIQVKRGQWSEAEQTLKKIQDLKMPERFALEGYLHWKRQKYSKAVGFYKLALSNGERAVEIYHGIANCLFQLGQIKEAARYIDEGLKNRARHNGLLIDFAAKMAIVAQDFEAAENYVEQLRRLNALTDYHHRAATLYAAMKKPATALPHAREAINGARGRFEVDCVLISILVDLKEFVEAENRLRELELKDAAGSRKDVRLGLRLKLLLRQGDWRGAEAIWQLITDKTTAIPKALRTELLERKLADKSLPQYERESAIEELKILAGEENTKSVLFDEDYEPELAEGESEVENVSEASPSRT